MAEMRGKRSSWGAPRAKVAASGAAGAASVVIVFVAGQLGVDVPPEVGAAVAALLAFGSGYVKKETKQ